MTAAVLQFPPPTRPILQPSLHARGARPYSYSGEIDEWHAPGMSVGRGTTWVAADAAWIVEPLLGRPRQTPPAWPGVPGAADRARAYGQHRGLYPYQCDGAAFLAERDYAVLMDQMGLGKSRQALIAAEARLSFAAMPPHECPAVLVQCPALAKRHWQREIKEVLGYDATVLHGLSPDEPPQSRYVIGNYDILYGARRRDASGKLHDVAKLPGWAPWLCNRFMIVIVDEIHLLRGRDSRRAKAIQKVCWGVPVVWGLTGTMMPNHVRDLWAQIDLITAGLHGRYWTWCEKYTGAHQGKYGWVDTGQDNLDELARRLSFFTLGRSLDTVGLQLPEKRREVYKVDVEISAPTVADAEEALKRQKVVAGALRATARAKRPVAIAQAVEAVQAGQKVIVYTYLREQCEAVAKGVKDKLGDDARVFCVHGEQTSDVRDAQALEFRNAAGPAAFVATIDSVGIAISLVGATLVIFADLMYEPHKLLQAEFRPYRHGAKLHVLVRYLIATGTIDEALADAVIGKLATIEATLGREADAGGLGELLAGDQKTTQAIVDGLFEKLKAMGGN